MPAPRKVLVVLLALGAAGVLALVISLLRQDRRQADDAPVKLPERVQRPADGDALPRPAPLDLPAPPPRPAPPPVTAKPEPAPLVGRVTGRLVLDATRRGQPGRIELLRGGGPGPAGLVASAPLHHGGEAGADGQFTLDEVPAVDYLLLAVSGEGFADARFGPFPLQAGSTLALGELAVPEGLQVAGEVRDERGRPVARAQVGLVQGAVSVPEPGLQALPQRVLLTDAEGRFEFPHVGEQDFAVTVSAPGYARARVPGGRLPGETRRRIEVPVTLTVPRPLTGTVLSAEDGRPLAGARVVASALTPGNESGFAVTDEQGEFVIDGVAPGQYAFRAQAEGHGFAVGRTPLEGPPVPVTLVLPKLRRVSGQVLGDDNQPIASFELRPHWSLHKRDPPSDAGPLQRVRDPAGRFTVEDIRAGWFRASVWAEGYALTQTEPVRVPAAHDLEGVVLRLSRGAALRGSVVDEAGEPVPGVRISLHLDREPELEWLRSTRPDPRLPSTVSGAQGEFVLGDLTPMAFQARFDHADFALRHLNGIALAAGDARELPPVVLQRAASVSGFATDDGGSGLPGLQVALEQVGGLSRHATSDGSGRFHFPRVAPGEYRLSCLAPGAGLAAVLEIGLHPPPSFEVSAGAAIEVSVRATR